MNYKILTFSLVGMMAIGVTPAHASGSKPASSKSVPHSATRTNVLTIGAMMPSKSVPMKNVDGTMVTVESLAGPKGTLVVFTCNHCPYAKAWEERIADIGNEFKKKGVGVIAINSNDPEKFPDDAFAPMVERAKKLGLEFPYVVDSTSNVAREYGATKTPEAYLFDAEGQLVYHGAVDDNARDPNGVEQKYLYNALTALVAGKPIEMTMSKAVGCSIKLRAQS